MINYIELRKNFINILNKNKPSSNCIYINANTNGAKPKYPFATVNFFTGFQGATNLNQTYSNGSTNKIKLTHHDQPTITVSIQTYSDNKDEAFQLALDTFSLINYVLNEEYANCDIIIVEIQQVQDRTSALEELYQEYKAGFDIRIRTSGQISKELDAVAGVEMAVNNEEFNI